jgi:hypothetical protein
VRAADRPCRSAQDRAFFEDCFPDLLVSLSEGRLTRKAFGGSPSMPDTQYLLHYDALPFV